MTAILSTDFVTRAPTREDSQAIVDLITAYDIATVGRPYFEMPSILEDWSTPGFDLAKDALLVLSAQEQIIGYEGILERNANGRLLADVHVHPNHARPAIGTHLLHPSLPPPP